MRLFYSFCLQPRRRRLDIHETVSRASRGWGGALASHAGGATTTDEDAAARSPPRLSRGDAFIS